MTIWTVTCGTLWVECTASACAEVTRALRAHREHFETLLSAAKPVATKIDNIKVADINFGVNNSRYCEKCCGATVRITSCSCLPSRSRRSLVFQADRASAAAWQDRARSRHSHQDQASRGVAVHSRHPGG
jgi:hypothetical protein